MTARKAQEPIAVAAFREVEGHRALGFGTGFGRDGEPEGRSQGTNDVDKWVQVINWFEKLWADLPDVVRLAEVDVDVGNIEDLEKLQEVLSRVVGSSSGEPRVGKDSNPNGDRTDMGFKFFIFILDRFEANGVYRRKEDLEIPLNKLDQWDKF
jgi:hypothetical protein